MRCEIEAIDRLQTLVGRRCLWARKGSNREWTGIRCRKRLNCSLLLKRPRQSHTTVYTVAEAAGFGRDCNHLNEDVVGLDCNTILRVPGMILAGKRLNENLVQVRKVQNLSGGSRPVSINGVRFEVSSRECPHKRFGGRFDGR
jgi:hypothetical protein